METAFGWLGQIFDAVLQFVPRLLVIRNTHAAVKWKLGGSVVAIEGGRRTWWWPWLTDIEVIVVARQTSDFRTQALTTQDRETVVAGAMIVYWINDVTQAIGARNWDVETTVQDITKSVVVEAITSRTFDALLDSIAEGQDGEFNVDITKKCRTRLAKFGVHVEHASLTDFAKSKVFKVLGGGHPIPEEGDE